MQDIADNGMLDCLRVIEPPSGVIETEKQKNLRIAAQWDTSCSFESTQNWKKQLKHYYNIEFLVDSLGEPIEGDNNPDQADLCEIVRAGISKNFPGENMQKLPLSIIEEIDCVGVPNQQENGKRICAATSESLFRKEGWSIFLKPSYIMIDNKELFSREGDGKNMAKISDSIISKATNGSKDTSFNKIVLKGLGFKTEDTKKLFKRTFVKPVLLG